MPREDIFCPFSLRIEPMERLFVLNFEGDPVYEGIELQWFDDPYHGTGLIVLMYRKDKHVDVHRAPGVTLDRRMFAVGAGLGDWAEVSFETASFEADAEGTSAEVAFHDTAGRRIALSVRPRAELQTPVTLLAPVGTDVAHPMSLFLVYMFDFDLLRSAGYEVTLTIDGEARVPAKLPIPLGLHRALMARYSPTPVVVVVNPSHDGPVPLLDLDESGRAQAERCTVEVDGDGAIQALSAREGLHTARLELGGFPDLRHEAPGSSRAGTWEIHIDAEPTIIEGRWTASRSGDTARIELDVTRGWRPHGLTLSYRLFVTFASFFRTWPTTYRWTAEVDLSSTPLMRAAWERTTK